ncbi:hypothetical protein [Streptomyces cucumeris]|uniref:hypothetical protein n=1 Tax=Streptomyces cucumeris TaxID=2962890 RepID=UPI003D72F1F9
MRLNSSDAANNRRGGLSNGDLSVNGKDLAAIGDAAFKLYERLEKDGDHAKDTSKKAAAALKEDFSIGSALGDVVEKWSQQVDSLMQACGHISNHLDYTTKAHAEGEYRIITSLQISEIEEHFQ